MFTIELCSWTIESNDKPPIDVITSTPSTNCQNSKAGMVQGELSLTTVFSVELLKDCRINTSGGGGLISPPGAKINIAQSPLRWTGVTSGLTHY